MNPANQNIRQSKKLRLFLAAFLIAVFIGPICTRAQSRETDASDAEVLKLEIQGLESLFQEIQKAVDDIPRDSFDLKDIAAKIGRDPVKLFEWVRDETRLVPYSGSLKGSAGVLMDRCGNSLDRALLLYEMLRRAGHKVQLVQGELTDVEAREIDKKGIFMPGEEIEPFSFPAIGDFRERIIPFAEKHNLDAEEFLAETQEALKEQERLQVDLSRRVEEQSSDLLDAVQEIRKEEPAAPVPWKKFKDHWWVQYQKAGEWVDMDPTGREAVPGRTIGLQKKIIRSSRLSSSMVHSLAIRIIAERLESGRLIETKVLEHTLRLPDAVSQPVRLYQIPLDWPDLRKIMSGDFPQESFKEAVLSQKEWMPVLVIGRKEIKRSSILDSGDINKTPGKKPAKKSGGGMTGGFGNPFGGTSVSPEKKDSILTAEWIEYELRSPGQPPKKIRREIFDLIGPAARKSEHISTSKLNEKEKMRRNLLLLSEIEILPVVSRLTSEFIQNQIAEHILSQKQTLRAFVQKFEGLEPEQILTRMEQLSSRRWDLYNLALTRSRLSRNAGKTFLTKPQIFSAVSWMEENKKKELQVHHGIDIVANDMAVFPAEGIDSFAIRLEQGVLDTNAEVKAMGEEGWIENTAVLYEKAKEQGIRWVLLDSAEDADWQKVTLPPDVLTRIKNDVTEGYAVFVPEKPVQLAEEPRTGWWRVDPRTGRTIGMGESGLGQAITSYAERANVVLQVKSIIGIYSDLSRCLGIALTSPLRGKRPQEEKEFIECVWNTACKSVFRIAGKLVSVDVDWTNIIIKQTLNEATSSLCKGTYNKVFKE